MFKNPISDFCDAFWVRFIYVIIYLSQPCELWSLLQFDLYKCANRQHDQVVNLKIWIYQMRWMLDTWLLWCAKTIILQREVKNGSENHVVVEKKPMVLWGLTKYWQLCEPWQHFGEEFKEFVFGSMASIPGLSLWVILIMGKNLVYTNATKLIEGYVAPDLCLILEIISTLVPTSKRSCGTAICNAATFPSH